MSYIRGLLRDYEPSDGFFLALFPSPPHVTRYLERTGAGVTLLRPWDSRTPDTGHCFLLLSRVETGFYMGTGAQIQIGNPRQAKTKGRG